MVYGKFRNNNFYETLVMNLLYNLLCEYFDQNWYSNRFQMHLEPETLVVG